ENPHADDDPAFLSETDAASSTQSLTSSVQNYQYENGRRYHAFRQGEYAYPNDEKEQERLDLHHHVNLLALDGELFRAPVDMNGARVLDLGTGTGIWAVEVADEYPSAEVLGIDLSPIQQNWVPINCRFEVDDFELEWEYKKPFDFIHGRNLSGSVREFPQLLTRVKDNLNNGGWVELTDFVGETFSDDGGLERAPNVANWGRLLREASAKFGKQLNVAPFYKRWMIEAGFKNVEEEIYKIPYNPWPKDPKMKELGRYHLPNMVESLESYTMALFTRVLGWTPEEIHAFLPKVRKEMEDRSIHLYAKFVYIYGQKDDGE
ncbi:Methyltransferase, partial [Aspergillus sclerotialis]